jgi:hypothetical protein
LQETREAPAFARSPSPKLERLGLPALGSRTGVPVSVPKMKVTGRNAWSTSVDADEDEVLAAADRLLHAFGDVTTLEQR